MVKLASGLTAREGQSLAALFSTFTTDPVEPLFYRGLFMALTVAVVVGGQQSFHSAVARRPAERCH